MLNKSGESGHPYLVPDLKENNLVFPPLSKMLAVVLSYMVAFIRYVEVCPLYSHYIVSF